VFTGEYRHAIDGKGRVAVPARFRAELAQGAFVSRWIDSCLAIFPRKEWERLAGRVAELPYSDAGARVFARFLFSGAFEVELDGQGRVVLPAGLRDFADLKSDVVVVGARDRIELWEPSRWATYSAEMSSADALGARIQDLGI
jgi:MraZ protein